MADNIGRKDKQLFLTGLCTLARPYKILGLDPVGQIFSYSTFVIEPLSNNFFENRSKYYFRH